MATKFLKILCSLPSILLFLYFIPFVGICLILMRAFVYHNKRKISTSIFLIVIGILLLCPKILEKVFELLQMDLSKIPYLNEILTNDVYQNNLISYAKYLLLAGVIFLLLSLLFQSLFEKLGQLLNRGLQNYIKESVKQDEKIAKENDLKIKVKQEQAKNTNYVKCPYCGSDNLLSEKFGVCQFCRRKIENKNYKG